MTGIIVTNPPTVEVPPGSNASNPSSLPPITYTYALLNIPQTWTAQQNFSAGITFTGSIAASNLPLPTATTVGGVKSFAATANQFLTSIGVDGTPVAAQPSFSNISGTATAAQLPTPTATTLGGVKSLAAVSTKYLTSIGTDGTPTAAQPVWSDISGVPQTTVDTIAALKAISKTVYTRVAVLGYYAVGDCRVRAYYYDAADTTSLDNGGTIIAAADGGRWKLVDKQISIKTFGAKDDGTDQATVIQSAFQYAATNGIPIEFDAGNFSVSKLTLSGMSGLQVIWRGSLVGIAAVATDCVLEIINCTDITFNGRPIINGNYNTNYTYGIHLYTTAVSQSVALIDFTNVIVVGCKTAWGFGSTARPDDLISEINIRGGYTYGCPQVIKAIGTQTVVNFTSSIIRTDYGNGNAGWQTLPTTTVEAAGASVLIAGGELVCTAVTTNSLLLASAVAGGSGNQYGNLTITGALMEFANALAFTSTNSLATPTAGAIILTGCNFVHTQNLQTIVQADSAFAGRISFIGNRGFCSTARSFFNISVSNSACQIFVDMESFGTNFLQGYAGLNGGIQHLVSNDIVPGVIKSGSSGSQGLSDSIITFNPSATFTYTMLSPTVYPGRVLYLNNTAAFAINSASSNILLPTGVAGTSILPAAAGAWVILVSDTSQGNFWRVVASGNVSSAPVASVNITKFTSSGTYTPPANLLYAIIEAVGGGGGGGGVAGVAATNLSAGGGAAGGYARARASKATIGASATITVGPGGAGGAAGNNAGAAGNTTSFVSAGSVTLCAAAGGAAGQPTSSTNAVGGAAAGGSGSTGDLLTAGGYGGGGAGFGTAGNQAFYTGFGGSSALSGTSMTATGASAGSVGQNYGGGGSGATSVDTTNRAGGNGAAGIIVITEYLS